MRARYTYIPNSEIESITTWNGKEIQGSKLLDGAYARGKVQYGDGGTLNVKREELNSYSDEKIARIYSDLKGIDYSDMIIELKGNKAERQDAINEIMKETMADGGMMAKGGIAKKYNNLSKEEREELMREHIGIGRTPSSEYEKYEQLSPYHKKLVDKHFSNKMADGGMMAKGGYTSRHRKRTLEEKAQEMYGSDWFDLDERTRKKLIDDLRITKGEKGLIVGDKYVVTFTLDNGKTIKKSYSTKDELDEGIGDIYMENDVIDIKIEEPKAKEEEKKGIFKLAKITEKTTKAKEKRQGVVIEGIESDISRYEELKAIMKNAKAESDLIGGKIKELGFEKWLELYEKSRTNPNSIDLIDGDETIMLQVKDAYKKVIPEKKVILQEKYPDLIETTIVFNLNPTLLDKYGEVITNLINNSKDIEEKDKENLIKGESTTIIKSGSVDKILNYPNPEEVFILIEPTIALF